MTCMRWVGVLGVAMALAGCASRIGPGPDDAASDGSVDASQDAGGCLLPNGGFCPAGTSCPAGDGCNRCSCSPGSERAACTLLACAVDASSDVTSLDAAVDSSVDAGPADAAPQGCNQYTVCPPDTVCVYEPGCPQESTPQGTCQGVIFCDEPGPYCDCNYQTQFACQTTTPYMFGGPCDTPVQDAGPPPQSCFTDADCGSGDHCMFDNPGCGAPGVCRSDSSCSLPVAPEYCGCDGVTFQEPSNCTLRPYLHTGPCDQPDGGSCEGAAVGPGGGCLGPTDGPMPVECCYGYDCNQAHSPCDSLPPACPAGSTASIVIGACYGPCVPDTHCAPIACDSNFACPQSWTCVSGNCVPPPSP